MHTGIYTLICRIFCWSTTRKPGGWLWTISSLPVFRSRGSLTLSEGNHLIHHYKYLAVKKTLIHIIHILTVKIFSRDRDMRGSATLAYEDFIGLAMGAHSWKPLGSFWVGFPRFVDSKCSFKLYTYVLLWSSCPKKHNRKQYNATHDVDCGCKSALEAIKSLK